LALDCFCLADGGPSVPLLHDAKLITVGTFELFGQQHYDKRRRQMAPACMSCKLWNFYARYQTHSRSTSRMRDIIESGPKTNQLMKSNKFKLRSFARCLAPLLVSFFKLVK